MAEKKRNSSIELLRIICIFGIVFMHTIAYAGDEIAVGNRVIQIFVNCFTNLGVTCFMLISGYFGVRFQLKKLIRLDLMIIFYSLVHLLIKAGLGIEVGKMDILSSFFPVLSNQYWYMTAYFIIVVLSSFLNRIPEKLSRESFQKLLLILLFLFSVVPTFLSFDILGSEGKNVVHMTVIYLIGRYIRMYDDRVYHIKKVILLWMGNVLLAFALELLLFAVTGRYSLFYRDCSVFTVVSAVLLFTIFRNLHFYSRGINRLAGTVPAVYVFSFGFQRLIHQLIPLENYAFSAMLFPMVCIFAPCVVLGCMAIDLLRQMLFGKPEEKLSGRLAVLLRRILDFAGTHGEKASGAIIHFLSGK